MKVDNLLGPYLYQYKSLSLPGIGSFTLDANAVLPDESAKVKMAIEGISFSTKAGAALEDSLIQYIKEHTGKMKPLAEADLYSYITTAFQYLNIGKPFNFEGIGTLQKNKDGGYVFTAGTVVPQRSADVPLRHIDTSRKEERIADSPRSGSKSVNSGKMLVVLAVLATLGLVGWGGYYLYSKNAAADNPVAASSTKEPAAVSDTIVTTLPGADTTTGVRKDSLTSSVKPETTPAPVAAAPANGYKFIFETTTKKIRAAKRYEQLKGVSILKDFNNKVAVETKDSLTFNIYTIVPCTPADTGKVKEQLNAWYYGVKEMKVKLEH